METANRSGILALRQTHLRRTEQRILIRIVHRIASAMICGLLLSSWSAYSRAQCECGDCCGCAEEEYEPGIKFFDDLLYGLRPPDERDPFDERIETDRHDFTQSAKTVGRGVVQFESGYTYFFKDTEEDVDSSHTTPEMLVRLGLSEDIEFRLRWNYAWRFRTEGDNVDGAEDLRWAFKLGITDQCEGVPESALEIRFTAPTGGVAWTTERVEFGLDYIYDWEIITGWRLYGSTGFATNGLADFGFLPEEPASDQFILWSQSVALGIELTERTTLYSEYYGLFSHAVADEFTISIYNLGADFYVNDNFVLDVRAGVGLNDASDDLFVGAGGGVRF